MPLLNTNEHVQTEFRLNQPKVWDIFNPVTIATESAPAPRTGQTDLAEDVLKPKLCETLLSTDVVAVACGPEHAALTTKSGAAFTWGCGRSGRLGHGTNIDRFVTMTLIGWCGSQCGCIIDWCDNGG